MNELGLQKHVVFAGYIEEKELSEVYCACNVFIMPSYEIKIEGNYEGFGIAFLEAGPCGKPVIGSNSGGIPEAVINEVTGLLVEPMDVKTITEALIRLLIDEDYSRTLGENGRRRVERECSWRMVGEKIMAALEEFSARR